MAEPCIRLNESGLINGGNIFPSGRISNFHIHRHCIDEKQRSVIIYYNLIVEMLAKWKLSIVFVDVRAFAFEIVMTVQFLMKFQYMNILHYVYFLIKLIKTWNIFYPTLIFEIHKVFHYGIERIMYMYFLHSKIKTFFFRIQDIIQIQN